MFNETLINIAIIAGTMLLIACIGIIIVCIRWFIFKKKQGSLTSRLLPFILYGIFPFVSSELLTIKNPKTFLPYISPKNQLYIHLGTAVFGLIAITVYFVKKR